jgi:flagellar basal body-associated protein FliL
MSEEVNDSGAPVASKNKPKKSKIKRIILLVVLGGIGLVALLILLGVFIRKRCHRRFRAVSSQFALG